MAFDFVISHHTQIKAGSLSENTNVLLPIDL